MTGEPLIPKAEEPKDTQKVEAPDPQAFIDSYGLEADVKAPNGLPLTLGQALQIEALACTADPSRRQDPSLRIKHMAGMLAAAGSLREEHQHLLEDTE